MKLVTKVSEEIGLLNTETSGFFKISGSSKHLIYIQKSRKLGLINTTLPLPVGEPGTRGLKKPNGSIVCHVEPDLMHLERFLRMLADAGTVKHEQNKPRPFAPSKPPVRRPNPVVDPVPMSTVLAVTIEPMEFVDPDDPRPPALQVRLARIHIAARKSRVDRWVDEGFDRETAEKIADKILEPEDAREHLVAQRASEGRSETVSGIVAETGLELG